ncbi:hypothetical protein [Pseudonocardia sp. ICBG601]|uniref:hypothetical protein n=1 Tax=Pseudonocardia sp. ICBG601 TaxID=2846759 RepID=UPI0035AC22D2
MVAGIGGVALDLGNGFELGGIALGTILVIVYFHAVVRCATAGPGRPARPGRHAGTMVTRVDDGEAKDSP